jgi:hypothetical protein
MKLDNKIIKDIYSVPDNKLNDVIINIKPTLTKIPFNNDNTNIPNIIDENLGLRDIYNFDDIPQKFLQDTKTFNMCDEMFNNYLNCVYTTTDDYYAKTFTNIFDNLSTNPKYHCFYLINSRSNQFILKEYNTWKVINFRELINKLRMMIKSLLRQYLSRKSNSTYKHHELDIVKTAKYDIDQYTMTKYFKHYMYEILYNNKLSIKHMYPQLHAEYNFLIRSNFDLHSTTYKYFNTIIGYCTPETPFSKVCSNREPIKNISERYKLLKIQDYQSLYNVISIADRYKELDLKYGKKNFLITKF